MALANTFWKFFSFPGDCSSLANEKTDPWDSCANWVQKSEPTVISDLLSGSGWNFFSLLIEPYLYTNPALAPGNRKAENVYYVLC
jgi:hypothetical protein